MISEICSEMCSMRFFKDVLNKITVLSVPKCAHKPPDDVSKQLPNGVHMKVLELRPPHQPYHPIQTLSRPSKTCPKRPQDRHKIVVQLLVGCSGCRPRPLKEFNVEKHDGGIAQRTWIKTCLSGNDAPADMIMIS